MTNRNFLKNIVILSLSGILGGANTFAFDSVDLWNDAWELTCRYSYKSEYGKYKKAMEYVEKFLNGEQVKTSDKQPQDLKVTANDAKASILVAVCRAIFNYTVSIHKISEWWDDGAPSSHLENIRCDIEKARKLGENFGWPDESVECGERSGIGRATGKDARSCLSSALSHIDKLFNKQILTHREKFNLLMIDTFKGNDEKINEAMIQWDKTHRGILTTDGELLY